MLTMLNNKQTQTHAHTHNKIIRDLDFTLQVSETVNEKRFDFKPVTLDLVPKIGNWMQNEFIVTRNDGLEYALSMKVSKIISVCVF